jgi:hypothetical protein
MSPYTLIKSWEPDGHRMRLFAVAGQLIIYVRPFPHVRLFIVISRHNHCHRWNGAIRPEIASYVLWERPGAFWIVHLLCSRHCAVSENHANTPRHRYGSDDERNSMSLWDRPLRPSGQTRTASSPGRRKLLFKEVSSRSYQSSF